MGTAWHLIKRLATSLPRTPPSVDDETWVSAQLNPGEQGLWDRLSIPDRRHAILVARRLIDRLVPVAPGRAVVAAALLHDVGKLRSGLGTWSRVAATLIGPRGRRFRDYHDHEAIGAEMLSIAGSEAVPLALVGRLDGAPVTLIDALTWADDI